MDDISKPPKSSASDFVVENESRKSVLSDRSSSKEREGSSYWKRIVKNYEERNATLEKRRAALAERIHFMECALPSILAGAAVAAVSKKQRSSEREPNKSYLQNTSLR